MARVRLSEDMEEVLGFCAEECRRQRSGALSVLWMVRAWDLASRRAARRAKFTVADIQDIGSTIEPKKNARGFRSVPVFVGGYEKLDASLIDHSIRNLVAHQRDMTPAEIYLEFENIHPFVDGNGRTGKVILSWLTNRMEKPVWPPNFWGIENP
jgi:hypothetical protein